MSLRKILAIAAALATVAGTASVAEATTLLEPTRSYLAGTSEVVWGVTTQANGTAFTLNYGDGSPATAGTVIDRSYIAYNHTYAAGGTYTVTLTVGAEVATTNVAVYVASALSATDLRNLNVNRAIQDGLRYLWYAQTNRTSFDTNLTTSWLFDGYAYPNPGTALAVQAFQNQGYQLPNNDTTPTGIYENYAVRPGLNYILSNFTSLEVAVKNNGYNPCIGPLADPCAALYANTTGDSGYENGFALLALAGSGALARHVTDVTTANVTGQTLGAILQEVVDASIWGQNSYYGPGPYFLTGDPGRGGWHYQLDSAGSDGSVDGWELLGLLDASGAGATVPSWVNTEWSSFALPNAINTDGSFDYAADASPGSDSYPNLAKAGVGLTGMYFASYSPTNAAVLKSESFISNEWITPVISDYPCAGNGAYNKGCGYAMYNLFKGLKLQGVQTLPGVGRPAGPGTIAANDWYADYVDYLVSTQSAQTSTTGGNWPNIYWSGAFGGDGPETTALALLILAPTALVLPDPVIFSTLGLQQGSPLSTNPETDNVTTPTATHTVTAFTLASNNSPIAGVTVNFSVISGPNAGATGSGTSGSTGTTTFTYPDNGGEGTDNIQASVGALVSNVLVETWVLPCDVNNDGVVNNTDLTLIRAKFGQSPTGANAVFDANHDGAINVADLRYCQLRLTPTN
jgi:hypothetical protein